MADFNKETYTVKEAAAKLRVHTNTIYKMVRSGRLPAMKLCGESRPGYRIYGKDLEALKFNYTPESKPGRKTDQKEAQA